MKIKYDPEVGVYLLFEKEEGEVQLALQTLDAIARDLDDPQEADKVEHAILAIIEAENSHPN